MPNNSSTILGALIQRNKEKLEKNQAKDGSKIKANEKPRNEGRKPELRERSIDLLTKRLKIVAEAKQERTEVQISKEVNKWLQGLNPISLEINKPMSGENAVDHFNIDLPAFIDRYLVEKDREVARANEDNFELTGEQNQDLQVDEDYIETQLLNKKHFVQYEYKTKGKLSRYKTKTSVYDYITRTAGQLFSITDMKDYSEAIEDQKRDMINQEMYTILQNSVDMSIVDAGEANYEDSINAIMYHIMSYCNLVNRKRRENQAKLKEEDGTTDANLEQINGFVRPRVLVVLNYKYQFRDLVDRLYALGSIQPKPEVLERLEAEFESEDTALMNNFTIGVVFTAKSLQITTNLQHADIIFANPKHLVENVSNSASLLSSIEIVYVHKFSQFLMEDFSVFATLFETINQVPEHSHVDQDFRTVRPVHANHLSKFARQAIFYSELMSIELNAVINKFSLNYKGILKAKVFYPKPAYRPGISFSFKRLNVPRLATEYEDRYNFFGTEVWSDIRKNELYHNSIIFVNSYLLYKRLQKYLKEKHSPVGFISEHTPKNKVQSNFARFNNGEHKYLLVTERALHFKVCEPKRYKHIIFYNLPFSQQTFDGLIEDLEDDKDNQLVVLFSRKDVYELERLVGTTKALEFLNDQNAYKTLEFN